MCCHTVLTQTKLCANFAPEKLLSAHIVIAASGLHDIK